MVGVKLLLLVFAFVFFAVATIWRPEPPTYRLSLIAAGLACWVGASIF